MPPRVKKTYNLLPCQNPNLIEVCIDECARGCGFGSTFIGAVVIDNTFIEKMKEENIIIRDSKKMTPKQREKSFHFIKDNALVYSVVSKDNKRIDELNILQAVMEGMHDAIDNIREIMEIDKILVDGDKFIPYIRDNKEFEYECVVEGDGTYIGIAAASILAKHSHDVWIHHCVENDFENKYKKYGIESNMGYLTKVHLDAIKEYGISDMHRESFAPCNQYSNNPKFKNKKKFEKTKVNEKKVENIIQNTLHQFKFTDDNDSESES